jgi:subtilisin family serine protease
MAALALILLCLLVSPASAMASFEHSSPTGYVPAQVIVRFASAADSQARIASRRSTQVRFARKLPGPGLQLVRTVPGVSVPSAIASLEQDPDVMYAVPNRYYRIAAVPNDPRFDQLWGLNNIGQAVASTVGVADADIDAPEAWDLTTGSSNVTVAVIDTGIAYDHPDLRSNIWTNSGERGGGKQSNKRDDDGNGFTDDWHGWDFVSGDNDPRDLNGHGSHVAGTIGARGNDGSGITGVNWRVKLLPLRVADGSGTLTDAAIISALDYAAAAGARVVNASFTSSGYSPALLDAIRRHPEMLIVAAAGNGGDDGIGDNNDGEPQYPCNFSLVNVVCVAASDQSDKLAPFSNFGPRSVDLAAPGTNVLSAIPAYSQPIFSDGFENELDATWVTGGIQNTWARVSTVAHSGLFSLSDSPDATYLNGTDSFARTKQPFNLSGRLGCRVEYAIRLATELDADKLSLEASRDASNWTVISEMSGSTAGEFYELSDDLSSFDGDPSVYLRFHLTTNESLTADGGQLDDISVRCLSGTYAGDELGYREGTSMAAPHVSGVAALLLAKYPTLGTAGVREALLRGVDAKPAFAGKLATGGRLNARRALNAAARLVPEVTLTGPARQAISPDGTLVVYARCERRCAVVATGTLTAHGYASGAPLKKVARSLPARHRKRITVRLSRRALSAARRALARHRHVTATVSVTASDSHGNSIRRARNITLKAGR